MRLALTPHPDFPCAAITEIEVEIARPGPGALALRYVALGRMRELRLPPPQPSARADELWRHTCFEAFVRGPDSGYVELNFSPSTQWAAYGFSARRAGMRVLAELDPPRLETRSSEDRLVLQAMLDLEPLAGLPADGPWRLGLCAVIEQADGRLSYWALAHPPGRPDFHHADCFACEVLAPEPS